MNSTLRFLTGAAGLTVCAALGPRDARAQYPTTPPPPMPLAPTRFPPFQQARLANGLKVIVVENHELPIVSISLAMPGGNKYEPAGQEGLADLTADVLTKGTATRTADQIAATIEGVGGSLNAGAGADFFNVGTTVLTDHAELAFDLVGDVVRNPAFPESEVGLARTRELSALRLAASTPSTLAAEFFAAGVYGNHPYGRRATEATMGALTQQSVKAFAAQHLRPGGSLLVVSGDITLAKVRQLADRFLGPWSGTASPADSVGVPAAQPTGITLVNRPGSVQSDIVVGNLALRPGDQRWYAMAVLNKVLGGGTDSRLFQIIREQHSWTYDAHSSMTRRQEVGTFSAGTETRTAVTDSALAETLRQLKRLQTEPVPDAELNAAKGYLTGVFPLSIETPEQVAGQAANVTLLGLPADYLSTYRQRIQAVTAADVQHAAQALVKADSEVVVVVGDGAALYDKLAAIAPVRIIDKDGKPLTPADLAPKAAAVAWDTSQITARQDSFNLTFGGQPLGYWTRTITPGTADGKAILTYGEKASFGPLGTQQATVVVDRASMHATKDDQTGAVGGRTSEIHLTYAGGRVTGNVNVPRPGGQVRTGPVDTTLAAHVMDENLLVAFIEALPLAADQHFTVAQYNASSGAVENVEVKVSDGGSVTVPAGTFDVWKVETEGGEGVFTYYVAKSPRRLVKREFVGQPLVFELVK